MATTAKPKARRNATRRGKRKRVYTDADRVAAVLAVEAAAGDFAAVSAALGIPRPTLKDWCFGERSYHVLTLKEKYRGDMQKGFESAVWKLLHGLNDPTKLKTATLSQVATALGTAFNGMRLLDDKPTSKDEQTVRTVNVTANLDLTRLNADELRVLIATMDKLCARGSETGGNVGVGPAQPRGLPPLNVAGGATGADANLG